MKDELMEAAEIVVDGFNDVAEGEQMDVVALALLIFVTEFLAEIAPSLDEAMKGLDGLTRDVAAALKEYYTDQPMSH
ncbi:hypothetical protein [Caudoviricetes sp.]|nr:hypothetical protein [Caudoviricetes sp.]